MYVLRKGKKKDKQVHQSDPGSSRHKSALRYFDIFLSGSYFMILSQWDVVFVAVVYQQVDEDHSIKAD